MKISPPSLDQRPGALMKTKRERAAFIAQKLNSLYPHPPIPLDHQDPYTLLIAVVLSAQCTDQRVNQITPQLFQLAHTPQKMARLNPGKIAAIIRPCGLAPRKASAIHRLSQILITHHNGQVPGTFVELEALPGVGHKTASVVMAQAHGHPAFPVDTHIHRLAQRWGLSNGKNVQQTEADLKRLFVQKHWNKLHLQFIYYGREYCSARGCDGMTCEICRTCYPRRKRPKLTRKA